MSSLNLTAKLSLPAAGAKWGSGGSVVDDIDLKDRQEVGDIQVTRGYGAEISASVPVLGYYQGDKGDWQNYDHYDLSGKFLLGFGISVARSLDGKIGASVSFEIGVGGGLTQTEVRSDSQYRVNNPTGVFNNTAPQTRASTSGSAGKLASQMTGGAVTANNHATTLNQIQPTPVASPGGGSSKTGSNAQTGNQKPTTVANPPKSPPSSNNPLVNAWNWFASFFGGGKKK